MTLLERLILMLASFLIMPCMPGCVGDPIVPTEQRLQLRVTSPGDSGVPVPGVQVAALFRGNHKSASKLTSDVVALLDHAARFPENTGITGEDGHVVIDVWTSSRPRLNNELDDQVTKMSWAFRVAAPSQRDYLIIPKVYEGSVARGTAFEIHVLDIGPPRRRVSTETGHRNRDRQRNRDGFESARR